MTLHKKYNPFTQKLDYVEVSTTSIEAPITYYVDWDAGDNSNDGLTWWTAKKNLDLLDSSRSNALPRLINASVTINVRWTVLSTDSVRHTQIDNFYWTGSINIVGETTDVDTSILVTWRENTSSVQWYHNYLDASAETFTVNAHRWQFIIITWGTGAWSSMYPIMSNTATRIETVSLPNLDGTSVVKIVSVSQLKGATIATPWTLVDYSSTAFMILRNKIEIITNKLDYTNIFDKDQEFRTRENSWTIRMQNSAFAWKVTNWVNYAFFDYERCFFMFNSYAYFSTDQSVQVRVFDSVVTWTDGDGYGFYTSSNASLELIRMRIHNQTIGVKGNMGSFINLSWGISFEWNKTAIQWDLGEFSMMDYWDGYITFKDNIVAINMEGAKLKWTTQNHVHASGNTTEIKISDNAGDDILFSEIPNFPTVENTATGATIIWYDYISSYKLIQNSEYNNVASKLDARTFQNAIDELAVSWRAINSAISYYVDGDAWDDANDWLAWWTAKKTMSFLLSTDANALPRQINASVTINVRGTVLSTGSIRHTKLDDFYGKGQITINWQTTDVQTGIAVTGQDNTASSNEYHTYLDASWEAWTVNAHEKQFIVVTWGTGAGATLYPILSNTATRLETVGLIDLDWTSIIKIVSIPELKWATVATPWTLISYSGQYPFMLENNKIMIRINYLDTTNVLDDAQRWLIRNNLEVISLTYINTQQHFTVFDSTAVNVLNSNLNFRNYTYSESTGFSKLNILNSVIHSSDSTGYWIYPNKMGYGESHNNRFSNLLIALSADWKANFSIWNHNLFENCSTAIDLINSNVDITPWTSSAYVKFKTCAIAINVSWSKFLIGNATTFQWTGVTTEVKMSDLAGDTETFANLNARKAIQNTSAGVSVTYSNPTTFVSILKPEYDKTASWLTSNNFQGAIDELRQAENVLFDNDAVTTEVKTVQQALDYSWSWWAVKGFDITDNVDWTVDIDAWDAVARTWAENNSPMKWFRVTGVSALALTNNSINYVYLKYNSWSDDVTIEVTTNINEVIVTWRYAMYPIFRIGNDLDIIDIRRFNVDNPRTMGLKSFFTKRFEHVLGGTVTTDKTNMQFAITAWAYYILNTYIPHPALDTSGAWTFEYVYSDGWTGWTRVPAQTDIDYLKYDDWDWTLGNIWTGKWGNHRVYIKLNTWNTMNTVVVYGTESYGSLAEAVAAPAPSNLPPDLQFESTWTLVARITTKQNVTTAFEDIWVVVQDGIQPWVPTDHNSLGSLDLAGAWITWGHINALAQTIAGAKTFSSPIFATGLKSWTSQVNAWAAANEIWIDTADNSLKIGV